MSKYLDEIGVKYLWAKTKAHVEESINVIEGKIASVYEFKGSVDDMAGLKALPESNLRIGDVYNVRSNGMNYVWTGDKTSPDYEDGWDALGELFKVPTLTVEEIDQLLTEG